MKDQVKIKLPEGWEPSKTVDAGPEPIRYIGITETLDVVDFVAETAEAVKAAGEDGKITITDAVKFVAPLMKLPKALTGISLVPEELLGVDLEDAQDVIDAVVEKFEVSAETAKYIIENSVKGAVCIKNVVTALV
jgi:hypothetical protein